MKEQFCDHQTKCKEDTEDTWSCIAHIGDARVFKCRYSSLREAKSQRYPCDVTPPEVDKYQYCENI